MEKGPFSCRYGDFKTNEQMDYDRHTVNRHTRDQDMAR